MARSKVRLPSVRRLKLLQEMSLAGKVGLRRLVQGISRGEWQW